MLTLHEELFKESPSPICTAYFLLIFGLHYVWPVSPGPGCVDMGPRSRLLWSNFVGDPGKKVDFQGYHWGQNWRRLSLNICTPFSPLNVRPLVPPCLACPDKVWTADLRHRMFTRGIRCQRLSISICKNLENAAEVQFYCNPHLFRGYQWNKVSFCTCLMNVQEEYIASPCLSVV